MRKATDPTITAPSGGVTVGPLGQMEATCNAYGCKQTHGRYIRIGSHVTRLCDDHLADLRRQLHAR